MQKEDFYWDVWQLALDKQTYGEDFGKTIIVSYDGETEICGVIDNAEKIVAEHNKTVDQLFALVRQDVTPKRERRLAAKMFCKLFTIKWGNRYDGRNYL